ncbi:MAG TPA: S41 family peptidase [Gammaproteobacteria bacterium]|nr:S41 family peptidase [Gammaproteobacteria bacterium]
MIFRRNIFILIFGITVGVMLSLGHGVLADRSENQTSLSSLPLTELRTFSEVFGKIKSDYVKEVDDKTLLEGAIRGMLADLDPHSAYMDADSFKELQVGTTGEFGGLGIEVGMEDGFVKVIAPIDDTPAQKAGVQAGDLIIRLDSAPVKGMSLGDAVKIMRGKPGTDIVLTIVREGEEKPLTITITRAIIKVKSIKSRMLEDGFGYVRITQFQARSGKDLVKALKKLNSKSGGQLNGLVLDLRNNPGGVLNAAVDVSDAFLDKGTIVYTEGRIKNSEMRFNASSGDLLKGAPIVVLINGGSASASEIVAGALQDHKRAVIVGQPSFGKGSVQTILPMQGGTALKLTTALYYTPSGRSIQAEGIVPDIELESVKLAKTEHSLQMLKEADLAGHLENGNGSQKKASEAAQKKAKEDRPLAETDYPLFEALNLLKGLYILRDYNK